MAAKNSDDVSVELPILTADESVVVLEEPDVLDTELHFPKLLLDLVDNRVFEQARDQTAQILAERDSRRLYEHILVQVVQHRQHKALRLEDAWTHLCDKVDLLRCLIFWRLDRELL